MSPCGSSLCGAQARQKEVIARVCVCVLQQYGSFVFTTYETTTSLGAEGVCVIYRFEAAKEVLIVSEP